MDVKKVLDEFFTYLKEVSPDVTISEYSLDTVVSEIEETYTPNAMKILQKDDSFFSEPRMLNNIDLSKLVTEQTKENIWKHIQSCVIASFFHGDLKDKLSKILDTVKGIWNSSGQENDEISRVLNDEKSEGHLKDLIDFLSETRLAKLCMQLFEEIDFEDMANELNFENPNDIVEMMKNPENPVMKRIIGRIQTTLQQKMQRGEFTQHTITSEVEAIKAKVQSLFGNMFNEMLGGSRSDVPANVLMGNSPEARRQRMIARLQKKQREKTSR
jgi:hypothetical protein